MRALVIGCRPGSLGDAIDDELTRRGWVVITAGVDKEEARLDITQETDVAKFFMDRAPFDVVVNTAGINHPTFTDSVGLLKELEDHLLVNVYGHVAILSQWMARLPESVAYWRRQYVSISSNSARIARSRSLPYCASKAALSMAIRVAARDFAGMATVYAYEPGLLFGTPMTDEVLADLREDTASLDMHRMRGGPELTPGIRPGRLARMIADNLEHGGPELNGAIIRIDGGEQ